LRFITAADVKAGTLRQIINDNVSETVDVLVTDDFVSYEYAFKDRPLEAKHNSINHSKGKYVDGYVYTKTVETKTPVP
jgi:hypothetical protein